MIQKVKGTQDFLNLTLYNFIISKIKHYINLYHFTEVATPILEPLELFVRSLGEQTDVITKEMFIIDTEEKKEKICLRPEGTASIVRAFIEQGNIPVPWKVFSYGPIFRHERPQKGRYRQFHQVTMEIIGSSSVSEDVQLIKMLDRLFTNIFLLDNYGLAINFLGCSQDREHFKNLLKEFLNSIETSLCQTCLVRKEKNILRVFDCKNETCRALYKNAPFISKHLCKDCDHEWKVVQNQLNILSVPFTVVPTLVRGLDYYDKTVFEFVSDNLGAQNTFCGGGRYNTLVKELGGADQPAVGAALGIERLILLLEPFQSKLLLPGLLALYIIIPLAEEQQTLALLLADELQAAQFQTDILFQDSLKSMLRKANILGASYCILIGSEEQEQGTVTIKNMITGDEARIAQRELIAYLKK